MSEFGAIDELFSNRDVASLFGEKECFPEEGLNSSFASDVVPVLRDKLSMWVETAPMEDLMDASQVCKQLTSACNWTAIWSKDPLPATMYFAACMGILWGIPKFRDTLTCISRDEFRAKYPEFEVLVEDEQIRLFHFRNALHFGFRVVKPYRNKGLLIDLVPRLSERRVYTLGGGIGPSTQRRVMIYEREGNIPKRKQPIRVDHVMRLLDSSLEDLPVSGALGSNGDAYTFCNQYNIELPPPVHHSENAHGSQSYRSKQSKNQSKNKSKSKSKSNTESNSHNSSQSGSPVVSEDSSLQAPVGRVVEFLSHMPEDGVTIRTLSIRNGQNEELARHAGIMQTHANSTAPAGVPDTIDEATMEEMFVEDFGGGMNHRDAFVGNLDEYMANHSAEFQTSMNMPLDEMRCSSITLNGPLPRSISLNNTGNNTDLLVDPLDESANMSMRGTETSILTDFMLDDFYPLELPITRSSSVQRSHAPSFSSIVARSRQASTEYMRQLSVESGRQFSSDYASLPPWRHNSMGSRQPSVEGMPGTGIHMPPVVPRTSKLARKISRCHSREDFYIVDQVEKFLLSSEGSQEPPPSQVGLGSSSFPAAALQKDDSGSTPPRAPSSDSSGSSSHKKKKSSMAAAESVWVA